MARPQAAAVASRCEGQRGKSCFQRPDDDRDRQRNMPIYCCACFLPFSVLLYVSRVCVRWQQEKAIRCIQEKDINSNGERSRSITAQTGKVSSVRFMDGVEVCGQTTTPLLYNLSSYKRVLQQQQAI